MASERPLPNSLHPRSSSKSPFHLQDIPWSLSETVIRRWTSVPRKKPRLGPWLAVVNSRLSKLVRRDREPRAESTGNCSPYPALTPAGPLWSHHLIGSGRAAYHEVSSIVLGRSLVCTTNPWAWICHCPAKHSLTAPLVRREAGTEKKWFRDSGRSQISVPCAQWVVCGAIEGLARQTRLDLG